MIEKIIEFSAKNKFLIFTLTAVAIAAAIWSLKTIPLDAIPDLSDTQVIIYSKWDRSPDLVEAQVTYPIVTSLLGAPKVKAVRGFSDFGFSYVYVIFDEGTDLYWARSRTLEYLSKITSKLPQGVQTELGPDATGVGWVLQYALYDPSGKHSLQEIRAFQDWNLRYHLQSVQGVAEVSPLGGFVKQYQVVVDPSRLAFYQLSVMDVVSTVRKSNQETGGGLLEFSGAEYMIRGRGLVKTIPDIENSAIKMDTRGRPILVKHVAKVSAGSEVRRGIADMDGKGDVVTGTVVMRSGENALNVIRRVKERIRELEPSFPSGVKLKILYDRSDLIVRAIDTLKHQLIEEMMIVSFVILIFLWHIPSAIVPIVTIPVSVLLSFILLHQMKLTSNVMSLAGIAISIGVLVDGAIVEVENAYKRLEEWEHGGRKGDFHEIRLKALKEVGPSVFFSLIVIAVAFMPIFTLVDQAGRLFKPLAWSKNLAMFIAAILAITLDPALRMLFARMDPIKTRWSWLSKTLTTLLVGKYYPEEQHPISKRLFRIYEPVCRWVLRHRKTTIAGALLLMLSTIPVYFRLGSEFMPPLYEGTILYMPTTLPGMSVTEAGKLLQTQDRILKQFPEVESVFGKAGRIDSSTDPAPFSMMETVVNLKPESEWRKIPRWYSSMPEFTKPVFRKFWPEHLGYEALIEEMNQKLQIPGTSNAWTMPIKNRLDMLSTGIRTPVGIKILGADLGEIEKIGAHLEMILKDVPGTRSAFAERSAGGYFLDFDLKRDEIARYGLSVEEVQSTIMSAIGGEVVSQTLEGRERYTINVRYPFELRNDLEKLKQVSVMSSLGSMVPLGTLADLRLTSGPSMIRNENGMLAGYVFVDVAGRDIGRYVRDARDKVARELKLPENYSLIWSGQYENMLKVRERLKVIVPLTLFLIALILYMNTKSKVKTAIILLAVPFSLIGAVWLLWILGYNISTAVWVGMIALMGLDAETGVFMMLFLDLSYQDAVRKGQMKNEKDLEEAVIHGAVKRIRPKLMTVMAAFMGLLPIMWSSGAGADMMKRIAAPMIGGLISSFLLELLIYPVLYSMWKSRELNQVPNSKQIPIIAP
ncbi:MAG: efflux RND transporter permease subunit [Candidatus Omnitrophica bacterium]|nr:efflux RND transporter permease subunit [Candidatus Omnitrophota bacterium]